MQKRNNFINNAKPTFPNLLHRALSKKDLDTEYINHCIKVSHNPKYIRSKEKDRNNMLKRCMECKDFINEHNLLYCMYCQDAYHSYCLNPILIKIPKNRECIVCPPCKEAQIKNQSKQLTMDVFTKHIKGSSNNETNHTNKSICFKCKKSLSKQGEISTCEKCKNEFHVNCFRVNEHEKIVCDTCEKKISFALRATKISDYFKTEKQMLGNKRSKSKENIDKVVENDLDIYKTISKTILKDNNSKNKGGHMKLPKTLNKKQKEKMMTSLFRALQVKNITFNDDLIYLDSDCPSTMNNSLLEPGIQSISDYNKKIYNAFKTRSRQGIYAPVEVIDDPVQRFIVKAIDDIAMNTIICEYTGEVTLLRKKIFDKNDSIMELIRTPSSNTSLVICPEQYGNLARFLSGINNYDAKLKKKQNVYSIRFSIEGSVHILLLASKNIKKGEILYYDYNAGGYGNYPTEHFV